MHSDSKSRLLGIIRKQIEPFGFRQEAENIFVRQCSNGLVNRISVPIDAPGAPSEMACTVNLSLKVKPEKVVAPSAAAGEPNGGDPARITANIGALMPTKKWHFWHFAVDEIADDVLAQIASSIRKHAIPWFERFRSADDILRASEDEAYVHRRKPVKFDQRSRDLVSRPQLV